MLNHERNICSRYSANSKERKRPYELVPPEARTRKVKNGEEKIIFRLLETRNEVKKMKAITVLEPWASLIACGAKKIETRSWKTSYRGKIAIHAAKSKKCIDMAGDEPFKSALKGNRGFMIDTKTGLVCCPGCVIAIADLVDCAQFAHTLIPKRNTILLKNQEVGKSEIEFGDCTPGRWGWILENVQRIKPVPVKGQQRIWNWNIPDDYFIENFFQGVK